MQIMFDLGIRNSLVRSVRFSVWRTDRSRRSEILPDLIPKLSLAGILTCSKILTPKQRGVSNQDWWLIGSNSNRTISGGLLDFNPIRDWNPSAIPTISQVISIIILIFVTWWFQVLRDAIDNKFVQNVWKHFDLRACAHNGHCKIVKI